MTRPVIDRFEDLYTPEPNTGCWLFIGYAKRYGQIQINGKGIRATRWAYEYFKGPIPYGICVCHKCDTPECVNPDHLFLGTQSENLTDARIKNRIPLGEKRKRSRLKNIDVIKIRQLLSEGSFNQDEIAFMFDVNRITINDIVRGRTWSWLNTGIDIDKSKIRSMGQKRRRSR